VKVKVKVTGNENVKIVFLRQKRINLRQTKSPRPKSPAYSTYSIECFVCCDFSVCHIPRVPFVHSMLERGRKLPLTLVNGGVNLRSKGRKIVCLWLKNGVPLFHLGIPTVLHITVAQLPKNEGCRWNFSARGRQSFS